MKDRLIYEKTKGSCDEHQCELFIKEKNSEWCMRVCNEAGFHYKLVEPEIKDQHTHNQERYFLLKNIGFRDILPYVKEIEELGKWLKDNPKECWETCTKGNTKVGDEIFLRRMDKPFRKVDYIFSGTEECVITYSETGHEAVTQLSNYEINIHKQGDR